MHLSSLPSINGSRRLLWIGLLVVIGLVGTLSSPAAGQLRIVNYNLAGLQGDVAALEAVFAAINDDDKPGFAVAPHVYVFQEVKSTNVATIDDLLNAAAPAGVNYSAGTYTNDDENGVSGAQAMWYRADVLVEIPAAHADIFTGAGRNADRWKLRLLGYDSPGAQFYIYSAHLKASPGSSNEQVRHQGVIALRDDADALPADAHVIYAGDMNFYDNGEDGYLEFFITGAGSAVDPLGTGPWSGPAHAIKHTQSPLLDPEGGLVGGGLNDRFDFQLISDEFDDADGLAIIDATYRALGNDGDHYDTAINDGINSYYPSDIFRSIELANLLHAASDHLPVIADYQIPAVMALEADDSFGRVIQGVVHELPFAISNVADVVVTEGADVLSFQATGTGALGGFVSGQTVALDDPFVDAFQIDTTLVGARTGVILLTSDDQGVQNDEITQAVTGTVLRPSDASFDADANVNELLLEWTLPADGDVHETSIDVFNHDFDIVQSRMDVDSVAGVSEPFAFVGGLVSLIGPEPATLTFSFDTGGLEPGLYEVAAEILTSDEDVPGEQFETIDLMIAVMLEADEPSEGDINDDGLVDVADLLLLLGAWGQCPDPPADCDADLDGNGVVDVVDLLALLGNWS
jgi:endonuclease/exonuclease/phosphatase family metal-dependent hydrolase